MTAAAAVAATATDNSIPVWVAALGLLAGALGALVTAWRGVRNNSTERDSVIVTSAGSAVMALEKALNAMTARAECAEAQSREYRVRIQELEGTLDRLQAVLDQTRTELSQLKETTNDVQRPL